MAKGTINQLANGQPLAQAVVASGKNPDGTAFVMEIQGVAGGVVVPTSDNRTSASPMPIQGVAGGVAVAVSDNRTTANPLPVSDVGRTILTVGAQALLVSGQTADLDVTLVSELAVDVLVTTALDAAATVQFILERKLSTGQYSPLWTSAAVSALGLVSTSIGAGLATAASIGLACRLRWVVTGAPTVGAAALSITGT